MVTYGLLLFCLHYFGTHCISLWHVPAAVSVCQITSNISYLFPLWCVGCQITNFSFWMNSVFLMYFPTTCAGTCQQSHDSQILWYSDKPTHNFNSQLIQIHASLITSMWYINNLMIIVNYKLEKRHEKYILNLNTNF